MRSSQDGSWVVWWRSCGSEGSVARGLPFGRPPRHTTFVSTITQHAPICQRHELGFPFLVDFKKLTLIAAKMQLSSILDLLLSLVLCTLKAAMALSAITIPKHHAPWTKQ